LKIHAGRKGGDSLLWSILLVERRGVRRLEGCYLKTEDLEEDTLLCYNIYLRT
jgi:hypothetical protein